MIRHIENKNWRKNVDKCWNVSQDITNCILNNPSYQHLEFDSKRIIDDSVNTSFMNKYLQNWVANEASPSSDQSSFSHNQKVFYNPDSDFWKNESMSKLKEDCNLYGLIECCKDTFNLDNLDGDYEFAGGKIAK